ncbi:hypothetical protein [Aeoliella sp.]|uniref:hypothetical protein n=1 Tax=Aeoliella sp. TaxID=2795800 RepID=UPI003CCB772A
MIAVQGCYARRKWSMICLLLALAASSGCNDRPELGTVAGSVMLDGKPLKFGKVMFQHVEGGQPATGEIQPDGSFVLSTFRPEDGAIVGAHRIRVVCYTSQDPARRAAEGPAGDALGELLIPESYSSLGASGLSAEVPPEGLSEFKIDLSSKGPKK